MIEEGYAYEYTYNTPYKYQGEFESAEKEARENERGLWNPNVCKENFLETKTEKEQFIAPISIPIQKEEPKKIEVEIEEKDCHPNYSGCLNPNASDYDCAGGSGNGPYYTGKVRVLGADVFRLDRDKDGWGCE